METIQSRKSGNPVLSVWSSGSSRATKDSADPCMPALLVERFSPLAMTHRAALIDRPPWDSLDLTKHETDSLYSHDVLQPIFHATAEGSQVLAKRLGR